MRAEMLKKREKYFLAIPDLDHEVLC